MHLVVDSGSHSATTPLLADTSDNVLLSAADGTDGPGRTALLPLSASINSAQPSPGSAVSSALSPSDRNTATDDNVRPSTAPKKGKAAREEEDDEPRTTHNLGHQRLNFGCFQLTTRAIPYVIFLSDITMATGAGMTVQFFALFFKDDFKLAPISVTGIFAVAPIMIALLSMLAMPLGRWIGRAPAAVLCDAVGTGALFAMSFPGNSLWLDICLYLLRTAAMNAGYPTQRAIMMDVVPKKDRGKWNSLEGVTAFTWTGSAALGGVLINTHDYRYTFRITGIIYIVSTVILSLLIPLTWGEIVDAGHSSASAAPGGGDVRTGPQVAGAAAGSTQAANESIVSEVDGPSNEHAFSGAEPPANTQVALSTSHGPLLGHSGRKDMVRDIICTTSQ